MTNYYKQFNLRQSSSKWKIVKTFEKKLRHQLKMNQEFDETLIVFKILITEYFKKIYDISLKNPNLNSKPIRMLNRILSSRIELNTDVSIAFDEKHFLKINLNVILMRSVGLDYAINGLGYTNTVDPSLKSLPYRSKQLAFVTHNAAYYGIPLFLGLFNSYFWFGILPILLLVILLEYRKAKIEYYQTLFN